MKKDLCYKRMFSLIIVLSLIVSTLASCGNKQDTKTSESVVPSKTPSEIADAIIEVIREDDNIYLETNNSVAGPVNISYSWEDYSGNLDTFVYGIIINEYELVYDVFNAAIELEDGRVIYGLGYSAFDGYYEADDGYGFFPAGFITYIGETGIPDDLIDSGTEIINLDYQDTNYGFIYSYECAPYLEHCVIWDQYLCYGVDENGRIFYTVKQYEKGCWDKTLGSLYSFDKGRYIYDLDVGNYVYLSGTSLSKQIDFDELEAEINRILDEQNFNFSRQDIETSVYMAQEAVSAYLLSLQEETFLGFNVDELIKYATQIDPMSCIRITPDGMVEIDLGDGAPGEPTAFVKWMTGISCGIIIASSIALDIFVPALRPLSGAVSGAAFEVFMQVVIENQHLEDVNWSKIAVAATSGALLAWACPLLASGATKGVVNIMGKTVSTSAISKLVGYATLTFSNALVTGTTSAAYSIIDGKTDKEVLNAFLIGAAIGGACSIIASVATEAGNAVMKAVEKAHPENWVTKATNAVGKFIGNHQIHLFSEEIESILAPKSVYEASRCAINELERQAAAENVIVEAVKQLPADNNQNFVKVDADGNILKKSQIEANGGNCVIKLKDNCDPAIKAAFKEFGITEIKVTNGIADLKGISVFEFIPVKGIGPNRDVNMQEYYKQLANTWSENPSTIPERIRAVLTETQIENLNSTMVQQALSDAMLTPHEGMDGVVYLVDRIVHNKIGHYGGVALAKVEASLQIGALYFTDLINTVPGIITGTLIAEGVNRE